jgi:hypothetical protein
MARTYAQVKTAIWGEDHFRELTGDAQLLYFMLKTAPVLSYCGVTDWRPSRIAANAADWDTERVISAGLELHQGLFIVVDAATEEVMIRTFVKHDGFMESPNIASAMVREYASIASKHLRGVLIHELIRLHDSDPDLKGWKKAAVLLSNPSVNPSINPSGWGSGNPFDVVEGRVNGTPRVTPPSLPSPSPSSLSPSVGVGLDADDDDSDDVPAVVEDRADVERICLRLAMRMVENGCKRPAITNRWRESARLMLDRDGRTEEQINTAIDWCQRDEFWRGNILSIPKLRAQYEKLRLAAARGGKSNVHPVDFGDKPTEPRPPSDDMRQRWKS